MAAGLLLVAMDVVLECQSMDAVCTMFDLMEWIIGGHMALYINDNNIVHYNTDASRSIMLRYSYFTGPGCLSHKDGSEPCSIPY